VIYSEKKYIGDIRRVEPDGPSSLLYFRSNKMLHDMHLLAFYDSLVQIRSVEILLEISLREQ